MLFRDRCEVGVAPVACGGALGQVQHLAHQQTVEFGQRTGVVGYEVGRRDAIDVEEDDVLSGRRGHAAVARGRERQFGARY